MIDKEWIAELDEKAALIAEHVRIALDGGPRNGNYNSINSPGKKLLEATLKLLDE